MVKGVRIASLDFIGEPSLSSHLLSVALEVIGLHKKLLKALKDGLKNLATTLLFCAVYSRTLILLNLGLNVSHSGE